jgi:hypothetical protein
MVVGRTLNGESENVDDYWEASLNLLAKEVPKWHCRMRETVHENSFKLPFEEM